MNQTALITGASTGIGREYAYTFAKKGYNVILVSRSKHKLDELAADIRMKHKVDTYVIAQDLSKERAASDVFEQVKTWKLQVDVLINNAGSGTTGEFLNSSETANHEQVMLNVNAVVNMTQKFLPDMVRRTSGDIINVASMAAFQPIPYMSIYAATKAFLLSFTEGLHEEYKGYGVRILAVCPGNTQTNFFDAAPDAIKAGKMRTPQQVVETSLRALDQGRSFIVDGKQNYATSLLPRLLPRKITAKISAMMMKKSMS
jgi:short-subunit dehydrogenase